MAASFKHWRLVQYQTESDMWHNLDRLGVLLVLMQVDRMFWPILTFLFAVGAVFKRMKVSFVRIHRH